MNHSSRFARLAADGRLLALVADGELPEWPADLSAVEDVRLGEIHDAYLAEFTRLEGDPTADLPTLRQLAARVAALRQEAATRMSSDTGAEGAGEGSEGAGTEGTGESTEGAGTEGTGSGTEGAGSTDAATEGAGTEGASGGDEAAREAELADIRRILDPPAPTTTVIQQVGMDAESVTAAMTAAAEAGARAATSVLAPLIERLRPPAAEVSAADFGAFRPTRLSPLVTESGEQRPTNARLVASADIPGVPMGADITDRQTLVNAFIRRHENLGVSAGVNDEKIPVASVQLDVPADRDLRGITDWQEARRKVLSVIGPEAEGVDPWTGKPALVAAGGIAAPLEPYYAQPVFATGARPVLEAMTTFVADRGGITLVRPPSLGSIIGIANPGLFTDGVTTDTDETFTSASAAFTAGDVGGAIVGAGIPAGTVINSVTNGTTVELSQNMTATATGVHFYLPRRNPNNLGAPVGLQSEAEDRIGSTKFTFDVPNGDIVSFVVRAIYTSLQFSNLTARTFPERVEAFIRLADALAARVAETALLDDIAAWSENLTAAKTFGTARQLLAQIERMAAYYRNVERMDPQAVLRVGMPAWAINAMRGDYISSFIGGASEWALSDAELEAWFQERRLMPFFYLDSPSDVQQLFAQVTSAAIGNGVLPSSGSWATVPDYPGSGSGSNFRNKVVTHMWAEGTWIDLTTGELNLGLVRDSVLNTQNRFRNFVEIWEAPAMVGVRSLRCVHTVASDGSYAAAASVALGAGSGL